MRLALAIDGGFKDTTGGLTVPVNAETARVLDEFALGEVLILPIDRSAGEFGVAPLIGVATDEAGGRVAHFGPGQRLRRRPPCWSPTGAAFGAIRFRR